MSVVEDVHMGVAFLVKVVECDDLFCVDASKPSNGFAMWTGGCDTLFWRGHHVQRLWSPEPSTGRWRHISPRRACDALHGLGQCPATPARPGREELPK